MAKEATATKKSPAAKPKTFHQENLERTAVRTTKATAPAAEPAAPLTVQFIPLDQIVVSPFEPQARRRARITDQEVAELAADIKLNADQGHGFNGLFQPIKVRPLFIPTGHEAEMKHGDFEIVFGEIRYLSHVKNKSATIAAVVENLDDEAAFRQQVSENDNRKEPHPIDQAVNYAFHKSLLDAKRENPLTVKEFAEIIGKPEKHVAGRLKLNNLIEVAQDDVEDGSLPLSLAAEISKFAPETQELILTHAYELEWRGGERVPNKSHPVSHKDLEAWIRQHVLLRLSNAPFDSKATDLRDDGLACVKCPSRSGANASLFDKDSLGKNDSCLDMACWESKCWRMVENSRAQLAADKEVDVSEIPIVKTFTHASGEDYLGMDSFVQLRDDAEGSTGKWCEFVEKAVNVQNSTRDKFGDVVTICRNKACETHKQKTEHSTNGSSSSRRVVSDEETLERESKARKVRKEELFDVKVGQAVRKRVFRAAAERFGDLVGEEPVGSLEKQLTDIIVRMRSRGEQPLTDVIYEIAAEWELDIAQNYHGGQSDADKINALTLEQKARLLYLYTHSHKGAMYWNSYVSQAEVKAIAVEWDIDYQLLDATERMNLCPKKEQQRFRDHIKRLEDGDRSAKLPRIWSTEYKQKA